jgi:hypothetical protein
MGKQPFEMEQVPLGLEGVQLLVAVQQIRRWSESSVGWRVDHQQRRCSLRLGSSVLRRPDAASRRSEIFEDLLRQDEGAEPAEQGRVQTVTLDFDLRAWTTTLTALS